MKVNIGHNSYNLKKEKNLECEGYDTVYGLCDSELKYIGINTSGDKSKVFNEQIFWHEVVHGMLFEIGQDTLSCDEVLVDSLGKVLWAFHRDNNLDKIYTYLGEK